MELQPERDGLDRYLEDTETIDWQTPAVMEKARDLCAGEAGARACVRALWAFVRDEVAEPSEDGPRNAGAPDGLRAAGEDGRSPALACRASQVLREGCGVDHARAHLLVALLRARGIPAGFVYQRLRRPSAGGAGPPLVLAGLAAVYLHDVARWALLDPRAPEPPGGPLPALEDAVPSVAADPEQGEETLGTVFARPHPGVVDVLSRAPSLEHARRFLPASLQGGS